MNVPLLDLKAAYATQADEIREAIQGVVESQYFINGPKVAELEAAVAAYVGAEHGIGCASGSDALVLALMALEIGPGDEVITSPFTFFATVGSIVRVGATPVFVDINPDTFNLDVSAIEAAITAKTRAIIPVHLFGQCMDLPGLAALREKTGIPLIEDAAQAIGARWGEVKAGSVGEIACFSFYPSKNLGAYGDAGLLTTQSEALAVRLKSLRAHGAYPRKYFHQWVGLNSRLDAIQAAVLTVKMRRLDGWHAARQANAAHYRVLFEEAGLGDHVRLPFEAEAAFHIYNQFCVRVSQRDALQAHLKARGVGTEIYYPLALHQQACFAFLGYGEGDFPEAESAAGEALAIPIYPELTLAQQRYVVEQIAAFYRDSA